MWFKPPVELTCKLLTRMPDQLRRRQRTDWADSATPGTIFDSFIEGPCFDRNGKLHLVDLPNGRILRVDGDNWETVVDYAGWPNGLALAADGSLVAADHKLGLVQLDLSAGTASPLLTSAASEAFKGCNDLTIHPDGSILFTDQGQTGLQDPTGRVWRYYPDGRLERLISNGPSPNGLALNGKSTHLYVAMTRSGQIWRFALRADGLVVKANNFVQLPGGHSGPDGMMFDQYDRLYVCDPSHASVWVIDPHGVPLFRLRSCAGRFITNCALTPDRKQVVITESETASILICDIPPHEPDREAA